MGKPVIDPGPVLVEPPKNFPPEKSLLETGWPAKWIAPEDAGDALSPELADALTSLNGLLLPAVQAAREVPLLVKFPEPPPASKLEDLDGVSLLDPPGAGSAEMFLKIEGIAGEANGAWGGLSDLIEDPGPIVEGPPKGPLPGNFGKVDEIFHKIGDALQEDLVSEEWLGVLENLNPAGLLLPAINGVQDSLLFVKVEFTEENLRDLKAEDFADEFGLLQAGDSGILAFSNEIKGEFTPIDEFALKLEDGGGDPFLDIIG